MAITASGLYYNTFLRMLTNLAAIDLSVETYNGSLFDNTITPNFDTDTYYGSAPYNAGEVTTATYWPAGGVALTGTGLSVSAGTLIFDASDVSQVSTTLSSARAYLWHCTGVTEEAVVLINFGQDYSTNNGTFGIQWAAGGVFTVDLTP